MTQNKKKPLLFSILGKKNAGKTTLVERLIPELKKREFKVGTIKHDAHDFEIDVPGKDSYRHQKAGSDISIISSSTKIGMTYKTDVELTPNELIEKFMQGMDVILCEGYKKHGFKKILVLGKTDTLSDFDFDNVIACVTYEIFDYDIPCFLESNPKGLSDFLINNK